MTDAVRDAAEDSLSELARAAHGSHDSHESLRADALAAWLAERTPRPPESLRARLATLLDEHARHVHVRGDAPLADALLDAAEWVLARLLVGDGLTHRSAALDLLAADALITYAFEAASDEPSRIEARAVRAMATLAALVA